MERLDKGLVDIGLLLGPVRQEKYDYFTLKQRDTYGLLMRDDCELAEQRSIQVEQLKELPLIIAEQTFSGHQILEGMGLDSMQIVGTYNLIYNAMFFVEKGIGAALCLDHLVNTEGRPLVFRPITPELSLDLTLVTKKYQTFSPAVKVFLERLKIRIQRTAENNE